MHLKKKVKEIIADQLCISEEEVKRSSLIIEDLGADSLDVFEIIMALDEEFDIEMPDEDAEKLTTVGKIIDYLEDIGVESSPATMHKQKEPVEEKATIRLNLTSPIVEVTQSEITKEEPKTSSQQAERYNTDKLKWSLVDFKSLEDMVKVLEFGAEKYSADNWKKGLPTKEICESLLRHTFAFMNGEDVDSDSKQSHIGHIMCNAMFLSHMLREKPEFDNRSVE